MHQSVAPMKIYKESRPIQMTTRLKTDTKKNIDEACCHLNSSASHQWKFNGYKTMMVMMMTKILMKNNDKINSRDQCNDGFYDGNGSTNTLACLFLNYELCF